MAAAVGGGVLLLLVKKKHSYDCTQGLFKGQYHPDCSFL
jgi:hypothetical protein